MICDFTKRSNKFICKKCGRNIDYKKGTIPTAKCRLPEDYKFRSGYLHGKKLMGVGDTLSNIISKMGYGYSPISRARAKITYLNKKGIDWCEQNQDVILIWLKEECVANRIQFLDLIGKSIIRLAIKKAKTQEIPI